MIQNDKISIVLLTVGITENTTEFKEYKRI